MIWNDKQPIYIQIRQRIIDLILSNSVKANEALPSVRQISTDLSVNPLTITKAYQSLVELGIIEKRRGLGMFLAKNARKELLKLEQEKFINQEWPLITKQIKMLELNIDDLKDKKIREK